MKIKNSSRGRLFISCKYPPAEELRCSRLLVGAQIRAGHFIFRVAYLLAIEDNTVMFASSNIVGKNQLPSPWLWEGWWSRVS